MSKKKRILKGLTMMIFPFISIFSWGQELKQTITISGEITSFKDGELLPGVAVVVKGTTKGVVSDFHGRYKIEDVPKGAVLVYSFIGMKTVELEAKKSVIDVSMKEDQVEMKEVVVTGFQKIDKHLFTGSAARVSGEEVKLEGVADISRSLQGQVAGVQIENISGTFGTTPMVRIRGAASILGANRPLWVVDGVVLEDAVELSEEEITSGDLSSILSSLTVAINPEDIESFQVLKDASATALYGAKAMNGVIVITTKKGQTGKLNVQYSTNLTVKTKPRYSQFDLLTSGEEMAVYQELYEKGWIDIASSNTAREHGALSNMFYEIAQGRLNWGTNGSLNYDYLQRYASANTDWFDILFKNSMSQQHSLSLSTGSEEANIRASLGYFTDPGQTIADNVKNYTGSLRGDFKLSEDLSVGLKLSGNVREQKVAASENRKFNAISGEYERNFDINPFNYALYTSRSVTPYDEKGNLQYFRKNYAPFNELEETELNYVNLDVYDIFLQSDIEYKFPFEEVGLKFRSSIQGRWYTSKATQNIHEDSNNANAYRADDPLFRDDNPFLYEDEDNPSEDPVSILPEGGFRKTTENTLFSFFIRNTLNYVKSINDVHKITAMAGMEVRKADRARDYFEGWGYNFSKGGIVFTNKNFIDYLNQRGQKYFSYTETRDRSFGVFLYGGYSYENKYVLNGTFRYDGNNKVGKSRTSRYLPTWNISGAWNVTEEQWAKDIEWLNRLKLKSTYGLAGDNPLNASAALLVYGTSPLRPEESEAETTLYIAGLENPSLTFEKLYELNIGIEATFLSNRITVEVDFFHRNSKDLLGGIITNAVGGEGTRVGNVGEMEINGVDFMINTKNLNSGDFKWSTNFTMGYSKNKITKWESQNRIGDAIRRNGGNFDGYPRGALFSIPFAKLDQNGVPVFYDDEGKMTQKIDLQESQSKTNNILSKLKYEGPVTPILTGGLANSFTYKNWRLNVGIVYNYGNKIRLDDAYYPRYSDYESLPGDLRNRRQLPGDEKITNIPVILTRVEKNKIDAAGLNPYELYNKSDLRVADGGFVRLKSIKLQYNATQQLFKNTAIRSAVFSLSGYNLWLIYSDAKLKGVDPEFYQSGGISLPLTSYYTLTATLKF